MMRTTISVIICTKNRFDDFCSTAASLMLQNRLPDEFVVVDSSYTSELEEYLKSTSFPVAAKYIHSKPGLTLQRNIGVRNSEGDLLFFFDDDMEFDVNYLARVEAVFARDVRGEVGSVGGRISNLFEDQPATFRYKIERLVFSLIRFVFGLDGWGSGRFRYSGMPTYSKSLENGGYIECLSGGLMAFRKEVFQKVEFDENMPGYGLMEDWAISKSVLDAGYRIYFEPAAVLKHKESSKNRLNRFGLAEMTVTNYAYLFHKNWNRNWLRKMAYYWALLGLIVINLTKKQGLQGTLSGIKKLRQDH